VTSAELAICDVHGGALRPPAQGRAWFQHMKEPHAKPAVPILDERIQKRSVL